MRVLADWVTELGRARPGGKLAPCDDRPQARRRCGRFSAMRSARNGCPTRSFAPRRPRRLPDAPKQSEVEEIVDGLEGDGPLALRNQALVELVYSAGLRSAEAVGLDLGDVDFEQELVHVRLGKGGKDRVVPLGEEAASSRRAVPARSTTATRARRRERALPLDARPPPRHVDAAPPRPAPAPAAARICDAPARRRRRPAHDPGAARPQLSLDDADVQPRRREATATASTTTRTLAPDRTRHASPSHVRGLTPAVSRKASPVFPARRLRRSEEPRFRLPIPVSTFERDTSGV